MDCVASTRMMINAYTILKENLQERDHLYNLGIGWEDNTSIKIKQKGKGSWHKSDSQDAR